MGKLQFAQLKHPTLKGKVEVFFQQNPQENRLAITIPGGTTAQVYMPAAAGKTQLWVDGKKSTLRLQSGFFEIKNMPAGKHLIVLKSQ